MAGPVSGPSAASTHSSGLSDCARLSEAGPSGAVVDGNICTAAFPDYIGPETEKKRYVSIDIPRVNVHCLFILLFLLFLRASGVQRIFVDEKWDSKRHERVLTFERRYFGNLCQSCFWIAESSRLYWDYTVCQFEISVLGLNSIIPMLFVIKERCIYLYFN